jgi:hypothetical protein
MKKNFYILNIIFIFALILALSCGCSKSETYTNIQTETVEEGITIFDKFDNIEEDFISDKKTLLNEILTYNEHENAAVITNEGETKIVSADIYLKENTVFTDSIKISNVKGIYLFNDFYSITDAYYDAKKALDNGEKVMVVLLDGFSLKQYEEASEKNCVPFLSKYYKHEALSVYTPVTNAGYAAIITGKNPDINGVHDRSFRDMNVESIFGYSLKSNKKSLLLEGDVKILNTETEPVLHVDENKDGDTDDEMYEKSKIMVTKDYDLIFLHFHGIDDRGHSYGPMVDETMEYIKKVDGYMETLSSMWQGTIIFTADHGMHETVEGGNHGLCRMSDMVVPYFLKK